MAEKGRLTLDLNVLSKYRNKEEFIADVRKRAFEMEVANHGCSQVVVQTFLDVFEIQNDALFRSAGPFAAGISLTGNNCGALIGGLMVLGTVFGRKDVKDGMAGIIAGIKPPRLLVKLFAKGNYFINCREITGTDLADPEKSRSYFDQGGLEKCARITSETAVIVAELLYDEFLKQNQTKAETRQR